MAIHQIAKIRINEWPVKTIFDPLTYKEHTIIQIDLGPILNLKLIPSLELTLTLVCTRSQSQFCIDPSANSQPTLFDYP